MGKSKIKKRQGSKNYIDILQYAVYFISIMFGCGILLEGYFFPYESLTVNIFAGAFFLFFLAGYYKSPRDLVINRKVLVLGLAFLTINIISIFTAANTREAVGGTLASCTGLLVYLLGLQVFIKRERIFTFIKIIYYFGTISATTGLISYIFKMNLLKSFQGDRIITTLGYANSGALLLVVIFLFGLLLQVKTEKQLYLYSFFNCLIFLAFLGTKSRTVLLLFPVILILLIFLSEWKIRLILVKRLMINLIPGLLFFPLVFNNVYGQRTSKDAIYSTVVVILIFFVIYLLEKLQFKITKEKFKLLFLSGLIVVLALASFGLVKQPGLVTDNEIIKRVQQINFQDQSVQERIIFNLDGLKIAKDNLLLGIGTGGWNSRYKAYQTFLYYTTEVHNHYLQVLIENGLIGFFIHVALWSILLYNIHKRLKERKELSEVILGVAVLSLAIHALVDFDLSYPFYNMFWWTLLAIFNPTTEGNSFRVNSFSLTTMTIIMTIFILFNSALLLGWNYARSGQSWLKSGNLIEAEKNFAKAAFFDHYNSSNYSILAQIAFSQENKVKAMMYLNKALKYDRYNYSLYLIKAQFLLYSGKDEEAFNVAQKAIALAPWEERLYYQLIDIFSCKTQTTSYAWEIIGLSKKQTNRADNKYLKWWHGPLPYSERVQELERARLGK